ncbi:MAG: 30S ribosomal protein S7 [Mycoplasmataceae bacterium]|nr:MAG: 30S ribosomal protein S7 [Mycoplasmataceae bacterium]
MRKKRIIKNRLAKPDKEYNSILVGQLINKVMKNGEKRKATNIVYQSAKTIEKKNSLPFLTILEGAVENIRPVIEMKSRRFGASKQRVPQQIDEIRSIKIGLRWIVSAAREKKNFHSMWEKLAEEINNAHNKSGGAFKMKDDLYKQAESGRVFSFKR